MSKTAVETPICDICGADVRAGSLFCYNCGGSLKQPDYDVVPTPLVKPSTSLRKNGVQKAAPPEKRVARQPRKIDRVAVEVVWEPREGVSLIYVTAGVLLLVIAIVLFVTAIILK